jgi:hypothetical protein
MCKNIKFCSWISERGEEPCPLLIGLKSEDEKRNLMKKARDLQKTEYNDVTIGVCDLQAETGGEEHELGGGQEEKDHGRQFCKKLGSGC